MPTDDFFETSTKASKVKTNIIAGYFGAWSNIICQTMKERGQIAYVDLYSGPGYYRDGTMSTPLRVLDIAIANSSVRKMLVSQFNDKDMKSAQLLEEAIKSFANINLLNNPPQVYAFEVGSEIVKLFEGKKLVPTLLYLDPWGYKGLSLDLVNSVIKDWACECIFFFNYNRVNMDIKKEGVQQHIDGLFGKDRAYELRNMPSTLRPHERERIIISQLIEALKEVYGRYILKFKFIKGDGTRTSHYLIFISKSFKGYDRMKEIMARESSSLANDVPSFEYNPTDEFQTSLVLFDPLLELEKDLITAYSGRELTMMQLYEEHTVGTPYIRKNYKKVLGKLYEDGLITAQSQNGKPPRKGTFGDSIIVSFK